MHYKLIYQGVHTAQCILTMYSVSHNSTHVHTTQNITHIVYIKSVVNTMTTRQQLSCNFNAFIGKGKEFTLTELPTIRACLQRGILLREEYSILHDTDKFHSLNVTETAKRLAPLILQQWERANACFISPVIIKVGLYFAVFYQIEKHL